MKSWSVHVLYQAKDLMSPISLQGKAEYLNPGGSPKDRVALRSESGLFFRFSTYDELTLRSH